MNYSITIYSITNIKEVREFSDYKKTFDSYESLKNKLKNYRIINKIELTEGYKHNDTFKLLDSIMFNEKIADEKLSLAGNKKLKELFRCITYGSDYYKDGECYWNEKTSKYEINRKEEFTRDFSLANKELANLLSKNDDQIKIEDEQYNKIKGSYKCIVQEYNDNICYLGIATIPTRLEKIRSDYRNYTYKFKQEYTFSKEIVEKCQKVDYKNLFNRALNDYTDFPKDFPRSTGTGNDFVILLTDDEYKSIVEECQTITKKIENEKKEKDERERLEYEKEKRKAEKWENTFSIKKQIRLVYPKGGEDGTDGFYRVIIKHNDTDNEFDVILRNVFDVGCWAVIANKTDAVLTDNNSLADDEKLACKWVHDHSPFTTGIRM